MDVMRWDPLREMQEVSERLNRLLRRPEGSQRPRERDAREALTGADWSPNVDINETEAEYLLRVEVPGVKKEDVKITVQEGVRSSSKEFGTKTTTNRAASTIGWT